MATLFEKSGDSMEQLWTVWCLVKGCVEQALTSWDTCDLTFHSMLLKVFKQPLAKLITEALKLTSLYELTLEEAGVDLESWRHWSHRYPQILFVASKLRCSSCFPSLWLPDSL